MTVFVKTYLMYNVRKRGDLSQLFISTGVVITQNFLNVGHTNIITALMSTLFYTVAMATWVVVCALT